MTPSELKYHYLQANPDGKFFSRENMKFAGDTMRNFGCRKVNINGVDYWNLYRLRIIKGKTLTNSVYFSLDFKYKGSFVGQYTQ